MSKQVVTRWTLSPFWLGFLGGLTLIFSLTALVATLLRLV